MVEIKDIHPPQPIWPKRPTDKVERGKGNPDAGRNRKRPPRKEQEDDDSDAPSVDEYV